MDGTIVYADIGPSSFNRQSHQHHNIIPALDADPVKYAQIKHNNKHMETSSIAEKVQPSLRADIRGIGIWYIIMADAILFIVMLFFQKSDLMSLQS